MIISIKLYIHTDSVAFDPKQNQPYLPVLNASKESVHLIFLFLSQHFNHLHCLLKGSWSIFFHSLTHKLQRATSYTDSIITSDRKKQHRKPVFQFLYYTFSLFHKTNSFVLLKNLRVKSTRNTCSWNNSHFLVWAWRQQIHKFLDFN